MPPERMKMAMLVSAAIGILALASAGVLGVAKLIRYRREALSAPREAAAASPLPQVVPLGMPPSPTAPQNPFRVSERANPPAPKIAGAGDLSVRIIDAGIATGGGSGFVHADAVGPDERPVVVFTVMNVGAGVSDRWQFTANLPTLNGHFISDIQPPLAPGEGRRFTLGFGELLRQGENPLTISIFPWGGMDDAGLSNDAASAILIRSY